MGSARPVPPTFSSRETAADVCPMCGVQLGGSRGVTRRQIVFSATPGVFRWRCPDCTGVWQVSPAPSAEAVRGRATA